MQEIDIRHYNEMLRYERPMDDLRALATWIVETDNEFTVPSLHGHPKEYIFSLIKFYSRNFAEDIYDCSRVRDETINRLESGLSSVKKLLNITPEYIKRASDAQLYKNSGFWEMRKYLGQFGDVAESSVENNVSHLICAGISGCVVGEYLGLHYEKLGKDIPVDHMVFVRNGNVPVRGVLPEDTKISGSNVLLVDDAILETRTMRVMTSTISAKKPGVKFSAMFLDFEDDQNVRSYLKNFDHVYQFDE